MQEIRLCTEPYFIQGGGAVKKIVKKSAKKNKKTGEELLMTDEIHDEEEEIAGTNGEIEMFDDGDGDFDDSVRVIRRFNVKP